MRLTGHIPSSPQSAGTPLRCVPAYRLENPQSAIHRSTPLTALSLSKGNPHCRGFTLLEVLLAVSLVVLLVGAVYAFYSHTLDTRDHLRREGQVIFAQRRVLDLLTEQLQSTRSGLDGSGDTVSFMRTVVPGRPVFLTPNITRAPSIASDKTGPTPFDPQHDVQLVTYRLKRITDEDGVEQIAGLERTCIKTVTAKVAEEGENVEAVFLTEHVRFIHLQYWDGSDWSDSWTGRSLPQAVRIGLGTEPLPDDATADEYPYETLWRVVAIPAGLYQPEERKSRGAGGGGATGRTGMFTKRGGSR